MVTAPPRVQHPILRHHVAMDHDEQIAAFHRMQAGDEAAREQLIRSIFGLAVWFASTSERHLNRSFDERVADCVKACVVAVDTWEPGKGQLTTHATWEMRGAMRDGRREHRPFRGAATTVSYEDWMPSSRVAPEPGDALARRDEIEALRRRIDGLDRRRSETLKGRLRGETFLAIGEAMGFTRQAAQVAEDAALAELAEAFGVDPADRRRVRLRARDVAADRRAILGALQAANRDMSLAQLAEATHLHAENIRSAMRKLLAEGAVSRRHTTGKSDRCTAMYSIPNEV